MGCDLYAIETPSDYNPDAGPDLFYFRFGWTGMSLIVETLAAVDAIDFDTPCPEFPDFPARPQDWSARKEWDHNSDHAQARAYNDAADAVRRTPGIDNKPPQWKFGSNDGWVITPEECASIDTALRSLTREDVEYALGEELDEGAVITEEAVESWLRQCRAFADYCRRCRDLGGFAVC
jgi:hypothetical protein